MKIGIAADRPRQANNKGLPTTDESTSTCNKRLILRPFFLPLKLQQFNTGSLPAP